MNYEIIDGIKFYSASNNICGNPRFIVHFYNFLTKEERESNKKVIEKYEIAHKKANKIGYKIYRGKDFGGGFVRASYDLPYEAKLIKNCQSEILNK